jgi:hypothetical protein
MKDANVDRTEADPKGLVRESYAIEGITLAECRSIFIDWALSLTVGADTSAAINVLLEQYGTAAPDHPMTRTLTEGLATPAAPTRRGGRLGRQISGGGRIFRTKNPRNDLLAKDRDFSWKSRSSDFSYEKSWPKKDGPISGRAAPCGRRAV